MSKNKHEGATEDNAPTFSRAKALTLPTISFKNDGTKFLRLLGKIYVGKAIKQDGKTPEKPADLCEVMDLESGELSLLIVPALVKSTLEENYPSGGYVNKAFEIACHGTKDGKRYKTFSIYELED